MWEIRDHPLLFTYSNIYNTVAKYTTQAEEDLELVT